MNQRVDESHDLLGIYVPWINEFGKQCESVTVITQHAQPAFLVENVRVHSLGKEHNKPLWKQVFRFWLLLWQHARHNDFVLVHMIPEWAIIAAPICLLWRKPLYLFYAHKHTGIKVRLARWLCTGTFGSVPGSNHLKNSVFVGQGIPTTRFVRTNHEPISKIPRILVVGRISPSKNIEIVINAIKTLHDMSRPCSLWVIGGYDVNDDYYSSLAQLVRDFGLESSVVFMGKVPNELMPNEYAGADFLVNAATNTGADKVVFEAVFCGVLPITCDVAFSELIEHDVLRFLPGRSEHLAGCLRVLFDMPASEREVLRDVLFSCFVKNHGVEGQVGRLLGVMGVA